MTSSSDVRGTTLGCSSRTLVGVLLEGAGSRLNMFRRHPVYTHQRASRRHGVLDNSSWPLVNLGRESEILAPDAIVAADQTEPRGQDGTLSSP